MAYTLTPTNDLINHTKSFEGFMAEQYPDVIGNAIGYGNHYYYPNGVEGGAVLIPPDYGPITEQEAHNLCVQALTDCMIWTDRTINKAIKADLKQNQFEALACIVYAMGPGGFKGTSLFKAVNADPNNLVAIKNGFINAHQHKERLMMEYNYYETGKLACKAGYVPPSSSSGTSTASDAVSKDSARQIRYFNTNYCNSIICDGDLVNAGGTSGSNSDGGGSSGGGGSTGKTPVSKPENNKDGTVTGSKAANVLINAHKKGYRLWNWKCDGFELNGLTDTVKFSAIICKGNNNVGGLTVKIGAKKQYILYLKPNSLEVAQHMDDNTTNINQQQTSIQTPTKVTTMSYNDTTQMLREKGAKAQLSALEEFHLIIIDAKKTNIEWGKLENIFNEQPTNSSDTKKLSMFDVLYTHFKGLNQYKRIDDQTNYALLCNIGKKTINDEGIKAFFKKGLVYFTNINNKCNCEGKEAYFGNAGSAIVIIYPSGKIVRFSVGKNRGFGAGWDDIHMIRK